VTEFVGISLAFTYFAVGPDVSVPLAAAVLIGVTVTGSFRRWERFMFLFILVNLVAIPLAFMVHPRLAPVIHDTFVPGVQGGLDATSLLLIVAIVGTTVAPWQLFFQQSNVVDKRITPRWINYERLDTWIGAFVVVIGAAALIAVSAFAFKGTRFAGHFTDAGGTAHGLSTTLGSVAGGFFAVVLLNASLIGAGALTLSTSYAFGDMFGTKSSLHRSFSEAKGFYALYSLVVVAHYRGISIWSSGLGPTLLINIVFSLTIANISIGGHVGGFIGGLMCGVLYMELVDRRRMQKPFLLGCLVVAAISVAAAIAVAGGAGIAPNGLTI